MGEGLVVQFEMDLDSLPDPGESRSLDGHLLCNVTHSTATLYRSMLGSHHETINFHAIDSLQLPLILG